LILLFRGLCREQGSGEGEDPTDCQSIVVVVYETMKQKLILGDGMEEALIIVYSLL
jgi:hypothetical protein